MKPGDHIQINVYKADGICYRSWHTTIESVDPGSIVTISPAGEHVKDARGDWIGKHALRAYYWFDRPYNVIEVFEPNGLLVEIYINVASPLRFSGDTLAFTDYELDVSLNPPGPAKIHDEDEFAAAAQRYGYTQEFQRQAYQTAHEALLIAKTWQARSAPTFGGNDAQ